MQPIPTSKWAHDKDDDDVTADSRAAHKREKEKRKRWKEEAAPKSADQGRAATWPDAESARPAKRQRPSPDREADEAVAADHDNADMLSYPARPIHSCRRVEQYDILNDIEEGSYGSVSRAQTRSTGEIVALKRLKMNPAGDGFPVTGLREIQTLMACRHTNVVKLLDVVTGSKLSEVYLVMEFVEHDLKTLLDDMIEPFLPSEIKTLLLQIVAATEYLHAHWILHRDLKTSNLLLNNRGQVKLADFGMARYTSSPPPNLTQLVVTLWYRPPELLLGADKYGFEVDTWSLGCIFAELLTKEPLFQGKNEVDQISKILALLGSPTADTWPGFRLLPNAKALHPILSNPTFSSRSSLTTATFPFLSAAGRALLSSLLSLDPAKRPSARDILRHPYFTEDPRPKAKDIFPTFPSRAGQEKRRREPTPQAPIRGDAPKFEEQELVGLFGGVARKERGAGFSLRIG